MQTFSKALIDLVLAGTIDQEVAANASTNRHDFLVALERALKQQAVDVRQAEDEARQPEPTELGLPELRLAAPPAG
jgi:hypothetical protein